MNNLGITNFHSVINQQAVNNSTKSKVSLPQAHCVPVQSNLIHFYGIKPPDISYEKQIRHLEIEMHKLGINASLFFDAGEKNLAMAKKALNCLSRLKDLGYKIPKMELHFDNSQEAFEGIKSDAAYLEVTHPHGKTHLAMYFNSPLYKNLTTNGELFRLKKDPLGSAFETDFYHEFAHAHQATSNIDNYNQVQKQRFDSDTNSEIIKNVSSYATGNKAEFVAEYFTFKMMGKKMDSEKLANLFEQCLGPKPD